MRVTVAGLLSSVVELSRLAASLRATGTTYGLADASAGAPILRLPL